MTSTPHAAGNDPAQSPIRTFPAASPGRWGTPIQMGEHRVLRRGRWRWLRALAWLLLLFFLTAAAFGVPLQAAADRLAPGDTALQLVGRLVAGAAALGCYALAVRLGERRAPRELTLRPALPGLAVARAWED